MALTITKYGSDLAHIGRKPEWQIFDVAGVVTEGTGVVTESGVLRSLPIGTVLLDASACCIVAGTGTGTDVLSLQLALVGGDRIVWTGTPDNGGVIDQLDHGHILSATTHCLTTLDGSAFPVAETVNLEALRSISDDITIPAQWRVGVLLCRPEYDR